MTMNSSKNRMKQRDGNVPRFDSRGDLAIGVVFTVVGSLMGSTLVAGAATVVLKSDVEPVRGYFVSENAQGVILRVKGTDGKLSDRFISRESIDIVLRPVDERRLAALHPDRPREYRDYAEELSEKRVDPEARETSLRLYLMAAYLAPEELGKSALLGMTPLARNPTEVRRIRALAFMLDPERDQKLLKSVAASSEAAVETQVSESPQVNLLLRALELLRRGRHQEANRLIRRPGIAELLDEHGDILTFEEFIEACADRASRGPEPPSSLVARILKLELRLLDGRFGDGASDVTSDVSGPTLGWGELAPEQYRDVITELSLETLTEFDPRENLYRDGRWVRAD